MAVNHYEAEFLEMVAVEGHLFNAATHIRAAQLRLGDRGQLHEQIRGTLEALEEATVLAGRAKRIMLAEWRSSLVRQAAA
jgi:hypothetical protein